MQGVECLQQALWAPVQAVVVGQAAHVDARSGQGRHVACSTHTPGAAARARSVACGRWWVVLACTLRLTQALT